MKKKDFRKLKKRGYDLNKLNGENNLNKFLMTKAEADYIFKILVLGDPTTGKEELIKKYTHSIYDENFRSTIGVDLFLKVTDIDGKQCKLHLWDFKVSARYFVNLLSSHSRGAIGAFILYDITDSNSLKHVPEWLQIIRENTRDIPILLVGNKLDVEQNREVSKEQIEKLKKKYDISSSMEISVKTGENVEKMFLTITKLILEKLNEKMRRSSKKRNYMEANKILENIDKRKSMNYKTLYVEAMIREGNLSFNKREYETAAKQYERAGQWASRENLEKKIIVEAFRLAITSWISAFKVENAFRILESLSHQETLTILKELTKKIGSAAEFLVETKRFGLAREQLYNAIKRYQKEPLSDELEELTNRLTDLNTKEPPGVG